MPILCPLRHPDIHAAAAPTIPPPPAPQQHLHCLEVHLSPGTAFWYSQCIKTTLSVLLAYIRPWYFVKTALSGCLFTESPLPGRIQTWIHRDRACGKAWVFVTRLYSALPHSCKVQFFVPGPILSAYSLLTLGQVPQKVLGLSYRQITISPAHHSSKGGSQRWTWLRSQPCLPFLELYLQNVYLRNSPLHLDPAYNHLTGSSFSLCSAMKLSVFTPCSTLPCQTQKSKSEYSCHNGGDTFNSYPSSWVNVR